MFTFKTNSVKLSSKKNGILSVFSNTLKELNQLKEEQDNYRVKLQLKVDELKNESKEIDAQSLETKKIISKISEFLN
jgi:hypothetical protein